MRTHPTRRGGFTLVELMVAAALSILIMSILAGAFSAGLESLSHLRSVAGMAERLRSTHTQLSEDLTAAHFTAGDAAGGQRLSDLRYDIPLLTGRPPLPPPNPPAGGFVYIRQASGGLGGSIFEGLDQDSMFSTRADGNSGHVIGMTVRRTGKSPDQLFTNTFSGSTVTVLNATPSSDPAYPNMLSQFLGQNVSDTAPVNTFVSNWAEVYWFLDNPQTLAGVINYTLYRRVRLLTTTPIDGIPPVVAALLTDTISLRPSTTSPGNYVTNTLDSIRNPANRLFPAPNPPAVPIINPAGGYRRIQPTSLSNKFGDDIVLSNVLSFEVKATWTPDAGVVPVRSIVPLNQTPPPPPGTVVPTTPWSGAPGQMFNGDHPFDDLPPVPAAENPTYAGQPVYDSWFPNFTGGSWNVPGSPASLPMRARITGVKIKIRAFDVKTQMTRQSTLIVPL